MRASAFAPIVLVLSLAACGAPPAPCDASSCRDAATTGDARDAHDVAADHAIADEGPDVNVDVAADADDAAFDAPADIASDTTPGDTTIVPDVTTTDVVSTDAPTDSGACTMTLCGTACVDTQTDDANCGGCGQACQSAFGSHCTAGTCSRAPTNDACAMASLGALSTSVNGTTCAATADTMLSCGSATGGDVFYRVQIPQSSNATISVDPPTLDIEVRSSCTGAVIANGCGTGSVTVHSTQVAPYIVVVKSPTPSSCAGFRIRFMRN